MIRLQTFSGAVLFGDDGERLLGAASQRRILALVSVLAASGEGGLTRDKLVGLLWPETAPRRARHSLTQTMYAARRALSCDDLFQATEDIRLNPERISSDVGDFEAALRQGDDASMASLYRGPFLDGFYLPSSEFDWWLHHRRTALEQEAAAALHRLAAAAEESGDAEAAAGWLRRLSAIRPSDAGVAMRLMKALSAAGDRAGALQHATVHARLLREQYELEPEAEVMALAAELREAARVAEEEPVGAGELAEGRGGAVQAPTARPTDHLPSAIDVAPAPPRRAQSPANGATTTNGAAAANGSAVAHGVAAPEVAREPSPLAAHPASAAWPRPSRRGWLATGAVVLALLVVLVVLVVRHRPAPVAYPSLDQRVVVTPFRVGGADPSLDYLRDGMVEMLSTRLADDTAARAVDAGAVLGAWRAAGITRSVDISQDSIVRLAGRFGAERVVVGSVVGAPARVIIRASVLSVPSGQQLGEEATVEGPASNLTLLVDQLAVKLLLVEAGEIDRVAEHMTASLPALRAYLAGVGADARGDYALSARQYTRALQADTGFALSALHLALSASRLNDYDLERQALYRAWRFHDALSARDGAQLNALTGPGYPLPSTAGQSISAWEQAARLAPNRGDVWYGLAKRILTDGAAAGLGDVRERTLAALQRAVALDGNNAAARLLLVRVAGDSAALADSLRLDTTSVSLGLFFRWRRAAERRDATGLARIAGAFASAGPTNLRQIAAVSEFDGLRPEDGARALNVLSARTNDSDQALGLLIAQHALALERGRPREALELTRQIQRLGPATRAHLRLRVLDAVFGDGDSTAAVAAARELEHTAANPDLANAAADACALAQWQLARGDTAGARVSLELLRKGPPDQPPVPVGASSPACTALVQGSLAVALRRPDARALLAHADSLVLSSTSVGDVAAFAPIVISRLYRRLGDRTAALQAIRRRPYLGGVWPRYLATELKEEGDLARDAGDVTAAARVYRQYVSLRADAETTLQPELRAVRAAAGLAAAN